MLLTKRSIKSTLCIKVANKNLEHDLSEKLKIQQKKTVIMVKLLFYVSVS